MWKHNFWGVLDLSTIKNGDLRNYYLPWGRIWICKGIDTIDEIVVLDQFWGHFFPKTFDFRAEGVKKVFGNIGAEMKEGNSISRFIVMRHVTLDFGRGKFCFWTAKTKFSVQVSLVLSS